MSTGRLDGPAAAAGRGWRRRAWLWGPVLAAMAVIFVLSAQSDLPDLPGGMVDTDAHFVAYATLAALAVRAFAGGRWDGVTWHAVAGGIVLAIAYGASDEWHQSFVPGRDASVRDWRADVMGAVVAGIAIYAWSIIAASRRRAA